MPMLHWTEHDFIGTLEVEPTVDEDSVWYEFVVHRKSVTLKMTVHPYESGIGIALMAEKEPLIELFVFVRDGAVALSEGLDEWLELRDCVLAGSRFSYISMGDVFDRRRYPWVHLVRVRVKPHIRVEIARA